MALRWALSRSTARSMSRASAASQISRCSSAALPAHAPERQSRDATSQLTNSLRARRIAKPTAMAAKPRVIRAMPTQSTSRTIDRPRYLLAQMAMTMLSPPSTAKNHQSDNPKRRSSNARSKSPTPRNNSTQARSRLTTRNVVSGHPNAMSPKATSMIPTMRNSHRHAMVTFALAYAQQTERDYRCLVEAVNDGHFAEHRVPS